MNFVIFFDPPTLRNDSFTAASVGIGTGRGLAVRAATFNHWQRIVGNGFGGIRDWGS